MVQDPHPRVKLEAVRGLSFDKSSESINAILSVTKEKMDYWTNYTVLHSLGPNEEAWRPDYLAGRLAKDMPEGAKVLDDVMSVSKAGGMAAPHLKVLLTEKVPEMRNKAMLALSNMKGNQNNGKLVFSRNCSACHKVGNDGKEFGPELTKIATKHNRIKLIESVVDPNAEVDKKYLATLVELDDGSIVSGLLVKESPSELEIFDGKKSVVVKVASISERKTLKQSSMPEGLAGAISPAEFLDVVEYLSQLK
jgi:putative heme-binding domain-containing protein